MECKLYFSVSSNPFIHPGHAYKESLQTCISLYIPVLLPVQMAALGHMHWQLRQTKGKQDDFSSTPALLQHIYRFCSPSMWQLNSLSTETIIVCKGVEKIMSVNSWNYKSSVYWLFVLHTSSLYHSSCCCYCSHDRTQNISSQAQLMEICRKAVPT